MAQELDAPFKDGKPSWASIYRSRGVEVSSTRPLFTGDVYEGVKVPGAYGNIKARAVMVIHHPCAMRVDGVDLIDKLLVVEVSKRREFTEAEWQGNYKVMPLPDLKPEASTSQRHQAANFERPQLVKPSQLTTRIATLSPMGVNLMLQRWVHYSSRVVVPSESFQEMIVGEYEEADLIEEWCDERAEIDVIDSTRACVAWLRQSIDGTTHQERLREPQSRSTVRVEMRAALKALP